MEKEPLSIPKSEKIRDAFLLTVSSVAIALIDSIINKGYSEPGMTAIEGLAAIISLISVSKLFSLYASSYKNNG